MTSTPPYPLLSIRQLEVEFLSRVGGTMAVKGIDLDIDAGEIVALVGESGSGKSVTAAAITGLLSHRDSAVDGAILFEGKDLLDLSEHQMEAVRGASIATIFQNPLSALDPSFTIGSQLAETLRWSQLRPTIGRTRADEPVDTRAQALEWLRRVGIQDVERVLGSYPHQLSGGMRQRVMIAMAVCNRPRLLIADEPTTALDAVLQKDILALLRKLNRELDMAVLMITHDFGVVSYLCERVAVMRHGRIVEIGDTQRLLSDPQHPYTRRLIDAVPDIGLRHRDPSPSRRLGSFRHAPEIAQQGLAPSNAVSSAKFAAAPAEDARALLEVRGLSKTFDLRGDTGKKTTLAAVSDVHFDVRRGEIFGLIGASGSGKSTLARLIAQLIEPSAGSIRFDGSDVSALSGSALRTFRRRFQFVFQDSTSSLNPRRTIADQLCDPALRLGVARDRRHALELAAQALQRVGMSADHLPRYPHAFSGGQRQRIGIARALIVEPEFIVLDEPTSALDVSIQAQVLNLLLSLRQSLNLTYLFIGHSLPVIEFLCDRVAVMEHGRLIETFDATNLHANAVQPSTRQLIDAILSTRSTSTADAPDTAKAVALALTRAA